MQHAEAFALDQISLATRSLFAATLTKAYAAAKLVIAGEPMFNRPAAIDNHGRIIQWAVDHGVAGLIESGQWAGVDMKYSTFAQPTGHYLEIRLPYSVATISQVANPKKQPRDVEFRANKRLSSQRWLTGLPNPRGDLSAVVGLPHILLTHGHQNLDFAHVCIPNDDHAQGYIYRSPNLMLMPQAITMPDPPPEDTDFEAVLTLKEEIDRWRKDNAE